LGRSLDKRSKAQQLCGKVRLGVPGAQLGATLRALALLESKIHEQALVCAHEVLVRGSIVEASAVATVEAAESIFEKLGIALGLVASVHMATAIATEARAEVGIMAEAWAMASIRVVAEVNIRAEA